MVWPLNLPGVDVSAPVPSAIRYAALLPTPLLSWTDPESWKSRSIVVDRAGHPVGLRAQRGLLRLRHVAQRERVERGVLPDRPGDLDAVRVEAVGEVGQLADDVRHRLVDRAGLVEVQQPRGLVRQPVAELVRDDVVALLPAAAVEHAAAVPERVVEQRPAGGRAQRRPGAEPDGRAQLLAVAGVDAEQLRQVDFEVLAEVRRRARRVVVRLVRLGRARASSTGTCARTSVLQSEPDAFLSGLFALSQTTWLRACAIWFSCSGTVPVRESTRTSSRTSAGPVTSVRQTGPAGMCDLGRDADQRRGRGTSAPASLAVSCPAEYAGWARAVTASAVARALSAVTAAAGASAERAGQGLTEDGEQRAGGVERRRPARRRGRAARRGPAGTSRSGPSPAAGASASGSGISSSSRPTSVSPNRAATRSRCARACSTAGAAAETPAGSGIGVAGRRAHPVRETAHVTGDHHGRVGGRLQEPLRGQRGRRRRKCGQTGAAARPTAEPESPESARTAWPLQATAMTTASAVSRPTRMFPLVARRPPGPGVRPNRSSGPDPGCLDLPS